MMLYEHYQEVRRLTEAICAPLQAEDYVVQPAEDVSPPKWHLAHTTWFFETFVVKPYLNRYREYNPHFGYLFNSYYQAAGERVPRPDRGNLSRPTVREIYAYRKHVDEAMAALFAGKELNGEAAARIELGINHEQQHQELLWTDIKYILGCNPLFPPYEKNISPGNKPLPEGKVQLPAGGWLPVPAGIYETGFAGDGFCYDNELRRHKVYLGDFQIYSNLVSNGEFMEFVEAGGYSDFRFWHAEGWDLVQQQKITAPLYWRKIDDRWYHYNLVGLEPVEEDLPVCHISYYEAAAFAAWKGCRLPTEAEWETASEQFDWGTRWEWTESAYLPYPGFTRAQGALGEYNGKFMVNQKVLRGASVATSPGHSRRTYRNFFHPHLRWQFSGLRLARENGRM